MQHSSVSEHLLVGLSNYMPSAQIWALSTVHLSEGNPLLSRNRAFKKHPVGAAPNLP